jgi:hypothetical protein
MLAVANAKMNALNDTTTNVLPNFFIVVKFNG